MATLMRSGTPNENLLHRSSAAALWNYTGALVRAALQFGIQVALARMLGPQVYGQFAVVLTLIGFGWLLADGGFGAALVQKETISDRDVGYALGWVLVISGLAGLTLSLLAPVVAGLFDDRSLTAVIRVVGPLVVVQALTNIPLSLLRRELDAKRVQVVQVGSYCAGFGFVGLLLAWLGFGLWSLVIGFSVQTLLTWLLAYVFTRHTLRPRLSGDADLRAFGFRVMLTNMANWAGDNLDRILIGKMWGMSPLGAYGAAANLAKAPMTLLVSSLQPVLFSSGAKFQQQPDKLRNGYLATLSAMALVAFPVFTGVTLYAEPLVTFVYGNAWREAIPLMRAFAVGVPFLVVSAVTGPLLWAINEVRIELKVQIAATALLLLSLVSLFAFPLSTAAWAIPFAMATKAVSLVLCLSRRIGISVRDVVRACVGGVGLSATVAMVWLVFLRFDVLPSPHRIALTVLVLSMVGLALRGSLLGMELRQLLVRQRSVSPIYDAFVKLLGL
jgi:PST family polysaccharide transporter